MTIGKDNETEQETADRLMLWGESNCDAGSAFREVLNLLVAANMQEAEEDNAQESYERKSRAETVLFLLATRVTRGHRWQKRHAE